MNMKPLKNIKHFLAYLTIVAFLSTSTNGLNHAKKTLPSQTDN